jgi:hypothetical protein
MVQWLILIPALKYASIIVPNYENMVSKVTACVDTRPCTYHTLICINTAEEYRRNVILLQVKAQWRLGSPKTTQTICSHYVSILVTTCLRRNQLLLKYKSVPCFTPSTCRGKRGPHGCALKDPRISRRPQSVPLMMPISEPNVAFDELCQLQNCEF